MAIFAKFYWLRCSLANFYWTVLVAPGLQKPITYSNGATGLSCYVAFLKPWNNKPGSPFHKKTLDRTWGWGFITAKLSNLQFQWLSYYLYKQHQSKHDNAYMLKTKLWRFRVIHRIEAFNLIKKFQKPIQFNNFISGWNWIELNWKAMILLPCRLISIIVSNNFSFYTNCTFKRINYCVFESTKSIVVDNLLIKVDNLLIKVDNLCLKKFIHNIHITHS